MIIILFVLLFIFPSGAVYETAELCEPAVVYATEVLPFTLEELDILYRIAWAEARGEDDKGITLVINVILNRVDDPAFPDTIRDVVFQPRQFTPVANGSFDRATPCDRIKEAVHKALRGYNDSRGTLFFNAVSLRHTSWAARNREYLFTHGGHSFYR